MLWNAVSGVYKGGPQLPALNLFPCHHLFSSKLFNNSYCSGLLYLKIFLCYRSCTSNLKMKHNVPNRLRGRPRNSARPSETISHQPGTSGSQSPSAGQLIRYTGSAAPLLSSAAHLNRPAEIVDLRLLKSRRAEQDNSYRVEHFQEGSQPWGMNPGTSFDTGYQQQYLQPRYSSEEYGSSGSAYPDWRTDSQPRSSIYQPPPPEYSSLQGLTRQSIADGETSRFTYQIPSLHERELCAGWSYPNQQHATESLKYHRVWRCNSRLEDGTRCAYWICRMQHVPSTERVGGLDWDPVCQGRLENGRHECMTCCSWCCYKEHDEYDTGADYHDYRRSTHMKPGGDVPCDSLVEYYGREYSLPYPFFEHKLILIFSEDRIERLILGRAHVMRQRYSSCEGRIRGHQSCCKVGPQHLEIGYTITRYVCMGCTAYGHLYEGDAYGGVLE